MKGYVWRLKYFHPSSLAFASGGNLVSYLYSNHIANLILGIVCLAVNVWIVSENIKDDRHEPI